VTWFAGSYHTYRNWETGIWGLFAHDLPETPFSMPAQRPANALPDPN
jgi:hypothetical protein